VFDSRDQRFARNIGIREVLVDDFQMARTDLTVLWSFYLIYEPTKPVRSTS
jgi:hypothetical protein